MADLTPITPKKLLPFYSDLEIIRTVIVAEFEAISLYEQMRNSTSNSAIISILDHIIKEEKEHAAEFQHLLIKMDQEYKNKMIETK